MECAAFAIVLVAFGIFLLLALANNQQRNNDRWNRSFSMAAHRFGGEFTRGGWFRNPTLRMQYGATHARLAAYRQGGSSGPWCAEMVVHVPESTELRCEIGLRTPQRKLARSTHGLQEVEFDWQDFRYNWQVLTDDGDDAALMLTRAARMQIDQLWKFPFRSEVSISLFPNWLIVRKVWDSNRPIDLESYVEMSLGLYDQLQVARSAGIEFVDGDAVTIVDDAQCRICGETLARDIVLCRRCKTPHHRDCWEYTGGCATYGCQETEYQMPGAPQRAPETPQQAPSKPFKPR